MSAGLREAVRAAEEAVAAVYRGNTRAVRLSMLTMLSGGHLLIEDVPGIGKTTLALALARAFRLEFRRIQMTSDMLPADLIGVSIFDPDSRQFVFHPGPLFAQVVLVDELNRATPKTQSALLEAMAEGAASVDGKPRPLPEPYVVLATQNPVEQVGTFPLPESQLDRFLMRIRLGYPDPATEAEMLLDRRFGARAVEVTAHLSAEGVLAARAEVSAVVVHADIADYVARIATATRNHAEIALGVSPRGSLALMQVARAAAWLDGRQYVTPADVYDHAQPVLAHRLLPRGMVNDQPMTALQEALVERVLDDVAAPT